MAVGDQPQIASGYWSSSLNERTEWPDLHIYVHKNLLADNVESVDFSIELMQAKTVGTVRLSGRNIDDPPLIDPKFLEDPNDVTRMLDGIIYLIAPDKIRLKLTIH